MEQAYRRHTISGLGLIQQRITVPGFENKAARQYVAGSEQETSAGKLAYDDGPLTIN